MLALLITAYIYAAVSTSVWPTGFALQRLGLKGPVKSVVGRVGYHKFKAGKLAEACCSPLYAYEFDRDDRVISGGPVSPPIDYGPVGPKPLTKLVYNESGEVIGEQTLSSDGSVYSDTKFLFDTHRNKIGEETYSASGRLYNKKVYSSGGRQRLIEEITDLFNGEPYGRWTYDQYDSFDNCTKRTSWTWREREGKWKWEPDSTYYKIITYYPR